MQTQRIFWYRPASRLTAIALLALSQTTQAAPLVVGALAGLDFADASFSFSGGSVSVVAGSLTSGVVVQNSQLGGSSAAATNFNTPLHLLSAPSLSSSTADTNSRFLFAQTAARPYTKSSARADRSATLAFSGSGTLTMSMPYYILAQIGVIEAPIDALATQAHAAVFIDAIDVANAAQFYTVERTISQSLGLTGQVEETGDLRLLVPFVDGQSFKLRMAVDTFANMLAPQATARFAFASALLPVPVPAGLWLLGSGLLAGLGMQRKR